MTATFSTLETFKERCCHRRGLNEFDTDSPMTRSAYKTCHINTAE